MHIHIYIYIYIIHICFRMCKSTECRAMRFKVIPCNVMSCTHVDVCDICIRAYVYDVDGWSEVNEALAFGREVSPSQRPVTLSNKLVGYSDNAHSTSL